ncbi:uncharacterized protein FOMMEDRAFT_163062 [Fomitiporia mediterranea MF3/22]|uniref:Uncharacterized protein n=1 Tax=Fomitiporia mediterranea (strain MF3/22) TaxID=694068 RepID=R7SIS0_FOMME|nr:uncharacterized protein FOMMEDRAFT_163062 [Fomitiporia mediterranea MF3/22]EJC97509.1 hypothetical protein FOMMEDRAFT_163062 [Fomitiporia mediterranea MF3/22]
MSVLCIRPYTAVFGLIGYGIQPVLYEPYLVSQSPFKRFSDINRFVPTLMNAAGSPSLLCVIGSHLLIHLKEAGERGMNEGTSYRLRTLSDIGFAEDAPTGTATGSNEE